MKKYHIILIMIFLSATGYSQFADDALRFSQVYYQGTARSMAVGGAFGALGADFSTASTNPAGLGMYRTGEFIFTPEVFSRKVSSLYNGSLAENSRTILDISNVGYVMVTQIGTQAGWKFFQFSVGMNRLNNFNSSIIMEGENIYNSKLDVYAELADGKTVDLEASL